MKQKKTNPSVTSKMDNRRWDDSKSDNGILRRWTNSTSRRMQAVLASAIRGCDGAPKDDPSKAVVWALRWDICNPSNDSLDPCNTSSFMGYKPDLMKEVDEFLHSLDQYPFHFVMHLMHAAEICGYFHPDEARRVFWYRFYQYIIKNNIHANIETKAELIERLEDR